MNNPDNPLVSLIIPVYNVAPYLEKCLDSCFAQTYANIEVIAVNDGSKDASGQILDLYARKENRLRVIHQSNGGVVNARKKGIEAARGAWLAFIDGDDYVTPDMVAVLLGAALDSHSDIAVGDFFLQNAKRIAISRNTLPYGNTSEGTAYALLTEKLIFSLSGKIYEAGLFRDIDAHEELKVGEDAYIVIQLCEKAAPRIVATGHPVYYYVFRETSVTNRPSRAAISSRLRFIEYVLEFYHTKNYAEHPFFKSCLARFVMNECFTYLRTGGHYDKIPDEIKTAVKYRYLHDRTACSMLPLWRRILLRAYAVSPIAGVIIRKGIIIIRSFTR